MKQFLKLTNKQCSDAGLAAILILLLIGYFSGIELFYKLSIPATILVMIWPKFFYPFGVFWYSLAHLLGNVVSRILLTLIYVVFVVPVGVIRQAIGKDPLQLKRFKKDENSMFKDRSHQYISKDLETPY